MAHYILFNIVQSMLNDKSQKTCPIGQACREPFPFPTMTLSYATACRLAFDLGKEVQINHNTWNEDINMSKITMFRCEMFKMRKIKPCNCVRKSLLFSTQMWGSKQNLPTLHGSNFRILQRFANKLRNFNKVCRCLKNWSKKQLHNVEPIPNTQLLCEWCLNNGLDQND